MTWTASAFAEVAALIAARSGLAFPEVRRSFAEAGIARAMARARIRDLDSYLDVVSSSSDALDVLIGEIVVGETYFARDGAQLEVIRSTILPDVAARQKEIRVWSAGCSTGEEAYSLGILFEESNLHEITRLDATDISASAIATATAGHYGEWSFRDVEEGWRRRYFTQSGKNRWAVANRFPPRITFTRHNLASSPIPSNAYDLILCRNVLMYFEPDVVSRVVAALIGALREGGWLLTSPSDPLLRASDGVDVVTTPAGLVYRRSNLHVLSSAADGRGNLSQACLEDRRLPRPQRAASTNGKRERPARGMSLRPLDEQTPVRDLTADMYLKEAMTLLDRQRPAEAVTAARRAVFLDRNSGLGHLLMGRALRLCGRVNAARRALERGRQLADGNVAPAIDAELQLLESPIEAAP